MHMPFCWFCHEATLLMAFNVLISLLFKGYSLVLNYSITISESMIFIIKLNLGHNHQIMFLD